MKFVPDKNKIVFSLVLFMAIAFAQFGRNKVQYGVIDWVYITTPEFEIFYPQDYDTLARFALIALSDCLDQLSYDFSYFPQDRIPIVIYPTQFDFQETNITPYILPEGVGGFTESFKNRVVVPFDGNWEKFRDVLRHELTHAFVSDFIYGGAPAGLLSLQRIFRMPLWLSEGIAEFESKGWDPEADMYLRDAILNDYVREPGELSGFLAYPQGQSMVHYIASRWGRKKIGEIVARGRVEISMDNTSESSLGINIKKFYEDWKVWAKKKYYPQLGDYSIPAEVAEQITKHSEDGSFFNFQPAYNPQKDQIAYISDKNDFADIWLVDVSTKRTRRLAKGERSGESESFHPLNGRISFSADGKHLVYSVKSDGKDCIAILNVKKAKVIKKLCFDTLGIRQINSPCLTPSGNKILFAGLSDGQKDIYICDTAGNYLTHLTNDIFDDDFPTIDPGETLIVISSDRPLENRRWEPGNYNLFLIDTLGNIVRTLTFDTIRANNLSPIFAPDSLILAYTSWKNGTPNIYIYDFGRDTTYPVTNLVCGAVSPSFSGDGKIAFSALWNYGWDIYVLENPLPIASEPKLFSTAFAEIESVHQEKPSHSDTNAVPELAGNLSKYRFTEGESDTTVKKYTPRFSADLASVNLGYSTYYGVQGSSILLLSDILGNHQIYIATDLSQNLDNSNFFLGYGYLRYRPDFYLSTFHYKYYFMDNIYRIFTDRFYGVNLGSIYPFSQFSRAELSLSFFALDRYYFDPPYDDTYCENFVLEGAFVTDNTRWGSIGPVAGSRKRLSCEIVPSIGKNPSQHWALESDIRLYNHFGKGYSIALRMTGGYSAGKEPKRYYLGGSEYWLNYNLARNDIFSIPAMYFSKMIMPLRGYNYFEFPGNAFGLVNFEFRYPFVEYLSLGFPPVTIRGIEGALFMDMGSATSPPFSCFKPFSNGRLNDLKMGIGVGMRSWIWIFILNYDIALPTDLSKFNAKPVHYISLGAEF